MTLPKRTKIVATIGPSTESLEMLERLIDAGVNVCRINFSHGAHKECAAIVDNVRKINEKSGHNVAILADLQGPKIRVGEIKGGKTEIKNGAKLKFVIGEIEGNSSQVSIDYTDFVKDVKIGDNILLDDGKLVLRALEKEGTSALITEVINGGILSSNKGVNLPNTQLSMPSLTEKDLEDLNFAIDQEVEWIALSFVRTANDIIELKKLIAAKNGVAKVIAKIEKPEAVRNIDGILQEADGIMVARGDLGVELPMEEVPLLQKSLVKKSLNNAKPVIIATQMMESMIEHYTPTRAEVNDVANAVLDGADAVMLSAETSVGKYPIEVVEKMSKIVRQVESAGSIYNYEFPPAGDEDRFISDSICFSAARLAQRTKAKGIVTMTHSGYTAFKISSFRPEAHIYIFSGNRSILNMLSLVWGVQAFYYDKFVSTDHTISDIKEMLKLMGHADTGDLIINVASMPIKDKGQSNMLKLSYIE